MKLNLRAFPCQRFNSRMKLNRFAMSNRQRMTSCFSFAMKAGVICGSNSGTKLLTESRTVNENEQNCSVRRIQSENCFFFSHVKLLNTLSPRLPSRFWFCIILHLFWHLSGHVCVTKIY